MTSVDTNVLIRILTNDDTNQSELATAFLRQQDRVLILKTVLLEVEWVLRSSYGFEPEAIVRAIRDLLRAPNLEVEDLPAVSRALDWFERGMDFADAMHLASTGDETLFATFDVSLQRAADRLGIGRVIAI